MADSRLFALDITAWAVAGVLFTETKRGPEVEAAHFRPVGAGSIEEALVEVVETCGGSALRCVVSYGAENFHYRSLNVPFDDRKKVRSVAPFEIEDSASFQDEPFLYDYLLQPAASGGTDLFAVLVEKEVIAQLLDMLREHELDPETVTVSGLPAFFDVCRRTEGGRTVGALLHLDGNRATLFAAVDGEPKAIRSFPRGPVSGGGPRPAGDEAISDDLSRVPSSAVAELIGNIRRTLAAVDASLSENRTTDMVLSGGVGLSAEEIQCLLDALENVRWNEPDMHGVDGPGMQTFTEHFPRGALDNVLALVHRTQKDRELINLRRGELEFSGGRKRYTRLFRVAALALVAAIVGGTAYLAVDYQMKTQQRAEFTEKIDTLYRETVGVAPPGPDPVKLLTVKVNELDGESAAAVRDPSVNTVRLMADISARLPKSMDISLDRLIYDRTSIRLRGLTDNFNTVDLMKKRLTESPLFSEVAIGSANVAPKDKGVRFELKLLL